MYTESEFYASAFMRSALLFGEEGLEILRNSKVAVCGAGGVGSYAAEAIVRAGVGQIKIIDCDTVSVSNINRQIHANILSVGELKTDVMAERLRQINPFSRIEPVNKFINAENVDEVIGGCDFVIDAIDTVSSKIGLAEYACAKGIGIVSSMGTGNKLHPEKLELTDIYKTSVCPLAKAMRAELKKRGIKKLLVCYSRELPVDHKEVSFKEPSGSMLAPKRKTIGSVSFVPPAAGLILAGEAVRHLLDI